MELLPCSAFIRGGCAGVRLAPVRSPDIVWLVLHILILKREQHAGNEILDENRR